MHILYIFTFGYSLKIWENTGTLEKELLIFKKLHADRNVHFTFLTYGKIEDKNYDLARYGINIIPIFMNREIPESKLFTFFYSLYFVLKNIKRFRKVSIIKQNQLSGVWLAILLKILLRRPLILRTGYDMYRFSVQENKSRLKRSLFLIVTNLSFLFADIYTVTSKSDLIFSEKYLISPKKILLRPNSVGVSNTLSIKSRYKMKILTVGRLEAQKNYQKLIEDFENSQYEIDIVGEGSEYNDLKALAKEKNVQLNFLGKFNNMELKKLYQKYIFYVSTSLFEGNPKTVLEAMSSGCVVLISKIDNHRELIVDNRNGFILDLDESFKKKIKVIKLDLNRLNNISRNAVSFVYENNSLEKLSYNLYKDYESIV